MLFEKCKWKNFVIIIKKNKGHCKNMKPIFNRVAKTLKEENENSVIAFVDCTKETKLNSRFKIKGFPTVKHFKVRSFYQDQIYFFIIKKFIGWTICLGLQWKKRRKNTWIFKKVLLFNKEI